jgi:hypothetical protein
MEQERRVSEGSARLADERFRWIFTRMQRAALPIHLALAALFIGLGLTVMVWVNFGSMALHAAVWVLLRNGRERGAFLLAVTNLVLLFVTATLLLGWASGFHYYLLVLPMLFVLHPSWSRRTKAVACTSTVGAYGLLALHAYLNGTLAAPVAPGVDVLGVFNAVSFAATMSVLAVIVGRATGDAVLGAVAGVLEGTVRDTDHVSRWGGEEFLVLFPNSTRAGAHYAGKRSGRNCVMSEPYVDTEVRVEAAAPG